MHVISEVFNMTAVKYSNFFPLIYSNVSINVPLSRPTSESQAKAQEDFFFYNVAFTSHICEFRESYLFICLKGIADIL